MRGCSRSWLVPYAREHSNTNVTRVFWSAAWTGSPIRFVTGFPSCWRKRRGSSPPTILCWNVDRAVFRVVIPARYASTRLPGKALMSIGGKPMVQWVYERACSAGADEVLIATDDLLIVSAGHSFGAEVIMTASTHTSGTDRIAEVARARGWPESDVVVNVQGDEPLIPPVLIKQVAELLGAHAEAQIATLSTGIGSVEELLNPNTVKVVTDSQGRAPYSS